ncbi:hypothetical protein WS62_26195 [Burkholderia sp. ABCPW 14]|nr:hypothetical protein WS62_26195 [Burkholderia sp. ABCPW 14]
MRCCAARACVMSWHARGAASQRGNAASRRRAQMQKAPASSEGFVFLRSAGATCINRSALWARLPIGSPTIAAHAPRRPQPRECD